MYALGIIDLDRYCTVWPFFKHESRREPMLAQVVDAIGWQKHPWPPLGTMLDLFLARLIDCKVMSLFGQVHQKTILSAGCRLIAKQRRFALKVA